MNNQFILITGASSGIGKELALELAQKKHNLVLIARRGTLLAQLKDQIEHDHNINVVCFSFDLADKNERSIKLAEIFSTYKIIQVYNNAGVGTYAPFANTDLDDHFKTIEVNVSALVEITHMACKHMLTHGLPSHITNIASMAAFVSMGQYSIYCGTKHFVRSFTEALAIEMKNTKIKFTCISPGGVETEFLSKAGQKLESGNSLILMKSNRVAKEAINAVENENLHHTPGLLNQLSLLIMKLLPKQLGNRLATFAMNKATSSTHS